ncbi:hypothetical protein ACMGDH_17760 [Sphingomonas sp. DT-207]|uniref:hypothetical protein n=1 Tax=Sphingomonas sp. DT-207 TaxID=3396167 RepID=UPI003F1E3462
MAVLFALALSVRLLVPSGFMPTQTPNGIVVSLCDGMGGKTMVLEIPWSDEDKKPAHPEQPQFCAFTALASPAIDNDPVIVRPPIAGSIQEIALPPPAAVSVPRSDFLVPPLRGPPALA